MAATTTQRPGRDMKTTQNSKSLAALADIQKLELRNIQSPEFEDLDIDDVIAECDAVIEAIRIRSAEESHRPNSTVPRKSHDSERTGASWSLDTSLLTPEEERTLFRGLNFARWSADRLRSSLKPSRPSRRVIGEILSLAASADRFRAQLASSNLRLISSIARRFSATRQQFEDHLSDGSVVLLGAIDKFDYSRGFRFSTYATHSIQRYFFRSWKKQQQRKVRFPNANPEMLNEVPTDADPTPEFTNPEAAVAVLLSHAGDTLEPREARILTDRYGLDSSRKAMTLRELSAELGISKERVRQLQMKALDKLREIISTNRLQLGAL